MVLNEFLERGCGCKKKKTGGNTTTTTTTNK